MSDFTLVLRVKGGRGGMGAIVRSAQSGGRKNGLWKEMNLIEGFHKIGSES